MARAGGRNSLPDIFSARLSPGRTSDVLVAPSSNPKIRSRRFSFVPSLERFTSGFAAPASSERTVVLDDSSQHGDALMVMGHVGVRCLVGPRTASDGTLGRSDHLEPAGSRTRRTASEGTELRDTPRGQRVRAEPVEKEGQQLRDTPQGRRTLRAQEKGGAKLEPIASAVNPMSHRLRSDFADQVVDDLLHTKTAVFQSAARRASLCP